MHCSEIDSSAAGGSQRSTGALRPCTEARLNCSPRRRERPGGAGKVRPNADPSEYVASFERPPVEDGVPPELVEAFELDDRYRALLED